MDAQTRQQLAQLDIMKANAELHQKQQAHTVEVANAAMKLKGTESRTAVDLLTLQQKEHESLRKHLHGAKK